MGGSHNQMVNPMGNMQVNPQSPDFQVLSIPAHSPAPAAAAARAFCGALKETNRSYRSHGPLSSPIYLSKILILRMSKQNKPSYSASGARAHTELVFSRWPAGGAGENSENCWVYGVPN